MNNKLFLFLTDIFKSKINKSASNIIAIDKKHLEKLIKKEINLHGLKCSLNHLDVSQITDMSSLFSKSKFNGDISQWDVSKVIDMHRMFHKSDFTGNLSNWDVSNVIDMNHMFSDALFNEDISKWNVEKVEDMDFMFSYSKFTQNLSDWKPYDLIYPDHIFHNSEAPIPYWNVYFDSEERKKAIDTHTLNKELNEELTNKIIQQKKLKI